MRAGTSVKKDDESSQAVEKGLHTKPFFGSLLGSQLPVRVLIERTQGAFTYVLVDSRNETLDRAMTPIDQTTSH